jgi:hypothetical protein
VYFPTNVYAQPTRAQTVQPVASRGSQNKLLILNVCLSIPVAMPSKAYICGRSIAEIGGSNLAEGMDARFLLFVMCSVCGGICGELIARAWDSHLSCMWLIVCGIETSNLRRPKKMPELCLYGPGKGNLITCYLYEIFAVYIGRRTSVWPFHLRFKMILTPSP